MVYEIWDLDSGNRLGEYGTQGEALAEVKHALDAHGEAYAATLLLDVEDDEGHTRLVAKGSQLVALAREVNGRNRVAGEDPTPLKPKMRAADGPGPSRRGVANSPRAPYSSRVVDGRQRVAAKSATEGGSRFIRRDQRGRFTSDQTIVGRSVAKDRQVETKHKAPKGQKDRSK
jgi:hypothetical protein